MTEIAFKKLNEKIALWLGFTDLHDSTFYKQRTIATFPIIKDDVVFSQKTVGQLPDFINYADNQVKWIYPKLNNESYCFYVTNPNNNHNKAYNVEICSDDFLTVCSANHEIPSVAFALAIEQLIDSLEKIKHGHTKSIS